MTDWKTEIRLRDGEAFLTCAHVANHKTAHIYGLPRKLEFTRADGSKGAYRWFAVCDDCRAKGEDLKDLFMVLAREYVWIGDEPLIVSPGTRRWA